MSNIATMSVNSAGGRHLNGGQRFVRLDGQLVIVVGDQVQSHGTHTQPSMVQGSQFVKINGIPVCREGDKASCGCESNGVSWARISN